jgi:hypothetical protein
MGNLVECKTCKHQVDEFAKSCPSCGAKNPGMNTAKGCLLMTGMIAIFSLAIAYCTRDTTPVIAEGKSAAYRILTDDDISVSHRIRHQRFIVSDDAKTFADKAATVIKAASDLRTEKFVNEANVVLRNEKGEALAIADFDDSRENHWEVKSSNAPDSLTPVEITP